MELKRVELDEYLNPTSEVEVKYLLTNYNNQLCEVITYKGLNKDGWYTNRKVWLIGDKVVRQEFRISGRNPIIWTE